MNRTPNPNPNPKLCELNRLHDRARAEALALRAQAMDDVWRGADALLGSAVQRVERSARRLSQTWRRHRQFVNGIAGTPAACGGTRQV
jgi:hypothetical protein